MSAKHDSDEAHQHEHSGHCAKCGRPRRVEHVYEINDRWLQMLLSGIARSMALETYRKGRSVWKMNVAGDDPVALDRCSARLAELAPKLEAELAAVTSRFVKEQCGVDLKVGR